MAEVCIEAMSCTGAWAMAGEAGLRLDRKSQPCGIDGKAEYPSANKTKRSPEGRRNSFRTPR